MAIPGKDEIVARLRQALSYLRGTPDPHASLGRAEIDRLVRDLEPPPPVEVPMTKEEAEDEAALKPKGGSARKAKAGEEI